MRTEPCPGIPKASFLGLPWELREQIYHDYFNVEGGYVFDGATDKLLQADGRQVDISLRYTCRSIAHETIDIPFRLNSIKFSTVHREDWQEMAGLLEWVLAFHSRLQKTLLARLSGLITPDMYHSSNPLYLEYMPAIKSFIDGYVKTELRLKSEMRDLDEWHNAIIGTLLMKQHERFSAKDEAPHAMRSCQDTTILANRAAASVLRTLAGRHPDECSQAIDAILPGWTASHSIFEVFDLTFVPWAVPPLSEVTRIAKELQLQAVLDRFTRWGTMKAENRDPNYTGPRYLYRDKAFFSAASMAIRFMDRATEQQRLSMRKVVIVEDHPAFPRGMCHGVGLIPFCKENKALHIEHRWNLWTTLCLQMQIPTVPTIARRCETIGLTDEEWDEFGGGSLPRSQEVFKRLFGSAFAQWTVHTMNILKMGMPFESYSVVLEGDPDLNHSTHAFHTVMERQIAWLTLNTDCVAKGLFAPPDHPDYPLMTRTSNEGVAPPESRSSFIQCNFTLDQPWDFGKLVEEYAIERQDVSLYMDDLGQPDDEDRFRVSTEILDLTHLKLLFFERKRLPAESEGMECNIEQSDTLCEGQEISQGHGFA